MPKKIDYPRASLKKSLELAHAIDGLGGQASVEMAADALSKKVSGAFQALVGASLKFGLISKEKGQLETTQLFRDHKLAYSDEEAATRLAEAFMNVPLFEDVVERFDGKSIPVDHFEKLLVREFGVPDQIASRVSKYFLEGAAECRLLDDANRLSKRSMQETDIEADERREIDESPIPERDVSGHKQYSVRITGPGMDSVIAVQEVEDLLIINAMLKKIEKKFLAAQEDDATKMRMESQSTSG